MVWCVPEGVVVLEVCTTYRPAAAQSAAQPKSRKPRQNQRERKGLRTLQRMSVVVFDTQVGYEFFAFQPPQRVFELHKLDKKVMLS